MRVIFKESIMDKNELENENDGVLSFTLYKIEKGREKICKCNPPHYVLDEVNRLVICNDCGAVVEPFEALLQMTKYIEEFAEYQREAINKINVYREMANEESRRRMKNKAFQEMDRNYQKGLYPYCPECGKIFDPAKIIRWQRKPEREE